MFHSGGATSVTHFHLPRWRERADDEDDEEVISEDLRARLSSVITDEESVLEALRYIITRLPLSDKDVRTIILTIAVMKGCFSGKYEDAALLVGLDPHQAMHDIKTFELRRSRISTSLFKAIVQDMDIMTVQYGPVGQHRHHEVTSRFLSPIFNRLVAEFGCAYRNRPGPVIDSSSTDKMVMEHCFNVHFNISILIVECHLKFQNRGERLETVAKYAIAPIRNIIISCLYMVSFAMKRLSNSFDLMEAHSHPRSLAAPYQEKIRLQGNFQFGRQWETPHFIRSLREITEIVFDLLLRGYLSSLRARRDHIKDSGPGNLSGECDKAIKAAEEALDKFQNAESQRQTGNVVGANQTVQNALASLKLSIEMAPILGKNESIMSSWDDDDFEVA